METRQRVQFYPILNNAILSSPTLGSILGAFYASNQKYFTVKQLQESTDLSETEIVSTITLLKRLGDIGTSENTGCVEDLFYIDTDGSVDQLRMSVTESKKLLNVLEQIMEHRDNSNEPLNAFIRNTIVLYSEVLDFIEFKIDEHFKE
ncbi:hypothetical protein [uncultured Croceitalea sp.]|uniref:hypothetical protein n=1 Tax=uncultured Croceitalea sp. TaxID=1798908 RepID=UPI00330601E2